MTQNQNFLKIFYNSKMTAYALSKQTGTGHWWSGKTDIIIVLARDNEMTQVRFIRAYQKIAECYIDVYKETKEAETLWGSTH